MLSKSWLENVIQRLPLEEQWTHYYARQQEYRQLDYILRSQSLANANADAAFHTSSEEGCQRERLSTLAQDFQELETMTPRPQIIARWLLNQRITYGRDDRYFLT